MLRVLDLFSGIGGFSLGLERTKGFTTIAFCEIDPFCQKVLAKHWPEVPIIADIHSIDEQTVKNLPKIDVICGGFPCQDISCAGKGAGIHAERSGLWWEMLRVIRLVRPTYVVVENVAALVNRGLNEVLGSLAEIGYDAEWQVLSAAQFGAPHLRKRIFVIAYSKGIGLQSTGIGSDTAKDGCWEKEHSTCVDGEDGALADAQRDRLQRAINPESWERAATIGRRLTNEACQNGGNWGEAPPALCRVDDELPRRVDRLRSLGNAVVPACIEHIGNCILASI